MSIGRTSIIPNGTHGSGGGFYELVMVTATGKNVNRRSRWWKRAMIVKPLRRNKPG